MSDSYCTNYPGFQGVISTLSFVKNEVLLEFLENYCLKELDKALYLREFSKLFVWCASYENGSADNPWECVLTSEQFKLLKQNGHFVVAVMFCRRSFQNSEVALIQIIDTRVRGHNLASALIYEFVRQNKTKTRPIEIALPQEVVIGATGFWAKWFRRNYSHYADELSVKQSALLKILETLRTEFRLFTEELRWDTLYEQGCAEETELQKYDEAQKWAVKNQDTLGKWIVTHLDESDWDVRLTDTVHEMMLSVKRKYNNTCEEQKCNSNRKRKNDEMLEQIVFMRVDQGHPLLRDSAPFYEFKAGAFPKEALWLLDEEQQKLTGLGKDECICDFVKRFLIPHGTPKALSEYQWVRYPKQTDISVLDITKIACKHDF